MWIPLILKLAVGLTEIGIGTYVLFKAKRNLTVWLFFLSGLFLGLWLVAKGLYNVESYFRDPILDNFVLFFGSFMSLFTYLLMLYFPKNYLPKKLKPVVNYSLILIYTFLAFSTSYYGVAHKLVDSGIYVPYMPNNPFVYTMFFNIQLGTSLLLVIYWIYAYFIAPNSEEKKFIIFSSVAFLLGRMGPGIFFNVYLVSIGICDYIDVIFATSLIWQIIFFYLICYKKAFIFNTAIQYSIFWLLLSSALILPSIFITKLSLYLNSLITESMSFELLPALIIYMPISLYIFTYLKYIQPFIDRWFFKYKYRLQDEFELTCKQLNNTLSENNFFSIISKLFKHHLYIKDISYYHFDSENSLFINKHTTDSTAPDSIVFQDIASHDSLTARLSCAHLPMFNYVYLIQSNQELLGALCLSNTQHLKPLSQDEHQFIHRIANVSASHLNNIHLYSKLEKQHLNLLNTQQSLIDSEKAKTSLFEQKNYIQKLSCGIIHEVKNTNLSIEALIKSILLNKSKTPDIILKAIGKQSNKLVNFSSNFLYNELIETNQIRIDLSLINLQTLLSDLIHNSMFFSFDDSLKINTTIDSNDFYFDYSKLTLILNNIFHNTAKFSCDNSRLDIFSKEKNDHIILTFKHFSSDTSDQSDITDQNSINATGLGLNISKKVLKYLKSDLIFEQKQGYFLTQLSLFKGLKKTCKTY